MPRQSIVFEILIASPSDVVDERRVLAEVSEDWNSANSRARSISLQPLRWELDAVPTQGGRPQEILNKQLVENADVLMAVFWSRLGTPTGQALSGTVEEIEHFRRGGKPVLLYFSEAAIPHGHDPEQFRLLNVYRRTLKANGLYQTFGNTEDLRRRATRDVARTVHDLTSGLTGTPGSSNLGSKNGTARVVLQARPAGGIPATNIRTMAVFGTIENLSPSNRIREYSCTLSIPKCCLSFNAASHPAEKESHDPNYRRFRHTERTHSNMAILPGDLFQVIAVEIAVGHLSGDEQAKCLQMDVIADALADGEALQVRRSVSELMST